jgi:hypothetical protein
MDRSTALSSRILGTLEDNDVGQNMYCAYTSDVQQDAIIL